MDIVMNEAMKRKVGASYRVDQRLFEGFGHLDSMIEDRQSERVYDSDVEGRI